MVETFFSGDLVISLSRYFYLKQSYEISTLYHLTLEEKSVRALSLHLELIATHFGNQMVFPTFKKPLTDWLGPKCKYKVSIYMDNIKVLICGRFNFGFVLNYFSSL